MFLTKSISKYQFLSFRIIFGLYLLQHFLLLIPFGREIFTHQGMLPDSKLNFTYGILPNILVFWDSPAFVTFFLITMVLFSSFFTVGFFRRTSAFILWYGWACLFGRNNLISNPSIPYVGLILLLTLLVPIGEPFSGTRQKKNFSWYFPSAVYWVAWFLLAAGYTFSGIVKLQSPSWVDGSAMVHLVDNPLARPNFIRTFFLGLPTWMTSLATWSSLAGEILFLPLSIHRRTRMVAWLWLLGMHLGILSMVNFADLTFGMIMIHLFTFDPDWLPAKANMKGKLLVLFDGVCGLCDRTIQMLLEEDRSHVLRFAPLQGSTAAEVFTRHPEVKKGPESLIFVKGFGEASERVYVQSEGVLRIFDALGGFWRVVSWLRVIPGAVRNAVYAWIARNRYTWFGKYDECQIPSAETRTRFLP
jgi:predicted DCC family thiol-disulfide oxidoreductase YuxK